MAPMPQEEPTLADLIARLATLGTLETVHGPRHPTAPKRELAPEIAQFLATYPFLRRDSGYVDFLECYAGAQLFDVATTLTTELPDRSYRVEVENVDLFGFSHLISYHIVEGDEDDLPIVDAGGFLQVANLTVTLYKLDASLPGESMRFESKSIAFDATGQRPWGVYAETGGPTGSGPIAHWSMPTYERSWETFRAFLGALVTGDVLHPPESSLGRNGRAGPPPVSR